MTDADLSRIRTWAEELVRVKYADEVARLVLAAIDELAVAEQRAERAESELAQRGRVPVEYHSTQDEFGSHFASVEIWDPGGGRWDASHKWRLNDPFRIRVTNATADLTPPAATAPLTVATALQDPRVGNAPHYARVAFTADDRELTLFWDTGNLYVYFPSGPYRDSGTAERMTAEALAFHCTKPARLVKPDGSPLEEP